MSEKCHKLHSKPKTTGEMNVALQTIREKLPQEHINKAMANFTKRLTQLTVYGCDYQWWPLRASAVTLSISKSAPSSHQQQSGFFQNH